MLYADHVGRLNHIYGIPFGILDAVNLEKLSGHELHPDNGAVLQ